MAGANRSAGVRNMRDRGKKDIINLPVETKRVKRRVKSDQVSSYSLRVHKHPRRRSADTNMLLDRELGPGEAELELINHQYRPFVTDSADKRPDVLVNSILHRISDPKIQLMSGALLGQLVKLERIDSFDQLISGIPPSIKEKILPNIGRSTWRAIARNPELRGLSKKIGYDENFIGELALNANSIYRQGTDVMRLVLPHLDKIIDDIDYANIGEQQIFNTRSPNLIPSGVYPTSSYGANEIAIGGPASQVTWVHSPPADASLLFDQMKKQLMVTPDNLGKITAHPMGFLPKYHSQALTMRPDGLSNSTIHIPMESINKVLAGFVLYSIKGEQLFVNPRIGKHQLDPTESKLRQKMFSLTSKNPTNIIRQIKEKGDSGYGDNEIDIYNRGQYSWLRGRREIADDSSITRSLFPHPLLRKVSTSYRDVDTDPTVSEELWNLTLASLPMIQK